MLQRYRRYGNAVTNKIILQRTINGKPQSLTIYIKLKQIMKTHENLDVWKKSAKVLGKRKSEGLNVNNPQ